MYRVFILVLTLFALSSILFAQQTPPLGLEQTTVTLDAKDLDVRDAIRALFARTNVSFAIDRNVQGKVNAGFKGVPMLVGLQQVLKQVDATYVVESGIYIIVPRLQTAEVVPSQETGVRMLDLDVSDALKRLPGTSVIEVSPGITGQVAVVGEYEEGATIGEIARQVDARVVKTEKGYRLEPKNSLRKRVSVVRYTDGDLRKIVIELLNMAGVDFIVSSGIVGKTTVSMGQTDVQSAIEALLTPIGGRILLRQGVFIVTVK